VSNCPNLARTTVIKVRFTLNFAVVFDFIYFRFRPSKAKSMVMSCRIGKTRQRGLKKSAEELRMGIHALRQYIDATMPVAPIGNGVQICSVYNFQILFRGFFFLFAAHRLMTQDDSVRQKAKRVIKKKKKHRPYGSVSPIR
jgi:hypothetical protein